MNPGKLIRQLIRESIASMTVSLSDGTEVEYGSESHIQEYDRMIGDLQNIKKSLRSRKNKESRKEAAGLQNAIGSLRHLRAKALRAYTKRNLLD